MNSFAFVIPYYRNPEMLKIQVENWNSYPHWIRDQVRVILIDDASPEPAEPIFRQCELRKSLYRVVEDIPWHQHAARNLGAKAMGKDDAWGLFTDMDILFEPETVERMLAKKWLPTEHYTFQRKFKDGRPPRFHCNSLLVTRGAYWSVGGYDERFSGTYGGDGIFLRALERETPRVHWEDIWCVGYNDTVPDCSTRDWGRKDTEWHKEYIRRRNEYKSVPGGLVPRNALQFDWKRIF